MESKERMSQDFAQYYRQLCGSLGLMPLSYVTAHAQIRTLNINADKIGASDWVPLLNALKINETIETIIIQSYANTSAYLDSQKTEIKKYPAIKNEELITRLCKTIKDCLVVNGKVKVLNLVGLNLKDNDIKVLSKGIQKNKSLTQISFERSLNGTKQFEDILHVIRSSMKISCVNLSGCHVDVSFTHLIADYLKCQMSVRHEQVWQDGLRYRRPALDSMGGLRRITLNNNPEFGDAGVDLLCSVIREDIWIKALDIQNCNISNEGGRRLLKMLELNSSLVVLDARKNNQLDSDILQKIQHQCRINWGAQETEFKWLTITESERKNTKQQIKKPIKSISIATSSGWSTPLRSAPTRVETSDSGIPWRTASRATRVRNNSPDRNSKECSSPSNSHPLKITQDNDYEVERRERDLEVQNLKEQVARLTNENSQLQYKCLDLERKQIETDETLDIIEHSFTNFHNFLDMLKQIGLGPLITFANLNDTSVKNQERPEELLANHNASGESQLDATNQMRSFLAERNFNLEHSNLKNMERESVKLPSKFEELISRAIENGENLVRMSSISRDSAVKDLVDTIAGSINCENNKNHAFSNKERVSKTSEKDILKSGLEPSGNSLIGQAQVERPPLTDRMRLKSIENSDYSLHFDSHTSNEGGDDLGHNNSASRNGEEAETLLPSAYLRANSDDSFSLSTSNDMSIYSIDSKE